MLISGTRTSAAAFAAAFVLCSVNSGCYEMKTGTNTMSTSDIWKAIENDDAATIRSMCKSGVDVEEVGRFDRVTPLEYAFFKRRKKAFDALLECGADPDRHLLSREHSGKTVTFKCAIISDSTWLEAVLLHGAKPDLWTRTGPNNSGTPLAATYAYSESPRSFQNAKLLIDAGADLDASITGDDNPLSLFASEEAWRVVLYLLEKGAEPHVGPQHSVFVTKIKNPGDFLSKQEDFIAVLQWLEKHNLDVANASWNGMKWDIPAFRKE